MSLGPTPHHWGVRPAPSAGSSVIPAEFSVLGSLWNLPEGNQGETGPENLTNVSIATACPANTPRMAVNQAVRGQVAGVRSPWKGTSQNRAGLLVLTPASPRVRGWKRWTRLATTLQQKREVGLEMAVSGHALFYASFQISHASRSESSLDPVFSPVLTGRVPWS